jgi:WD40 repeat protein
MSRSKKRKLLAVSLLPVALAAALLGCPRGRKSGAGDNPITALDGHRLPIQALAFTPDGATLTSAAFYKEGRTAGVEVAVWDVESGHPVAKRIEYPGGVLSLAFAPGGQRLAAVQERALLLCDVAPWHERRQEGLRSFAPALAFTEDGAQLATTDFDSDVTLWDVESGRARARCPGYVGHVVALAFAPDGKTLAGGGKDNTIRLWDATTGEERGVLRGHARPVVAVAFAPDGRTLASGDLGGVVKLWDAAAQTERATLGRSGEDVSALAFAPDGRTLAVAVGRAVQLWDVATGQLVVRLDGHAGNVRCLAYAPDGSLLASGGHDKTVRLWDVAGVLPQRP